LLAPAFQGQGLTYEEVVWDTPGINWQNYDAVLIRETWDYFEEGKQEKFLQLLTTISQSGILLFNPLSVVSWNSKKDYLVQIKSNVINVPATIITTRKKTALIQPLLEKLGGNEFVIKPVVSAGASKTVRVSLQSAQETFQSTYALDEEVIIQLFLPEIVTDGELSFIFFDGLFSHTVKKMPGLGDFRVQTFHGGTDRKIDPDRWMISEATVILETALRLQGANEPLLCARVDVVERAGRLYLMELELIEPELYLNYQDGSADRFAECLKKRLMNLGM